MQAKDKPKRGRGKSPTVSQAPQAQLLPLDPPAETFMPDFSPEDRARASGILDAVDADRLQRNINYQGQVDRYNAAHPNAPYQDADDQQQRFLRRFLKGSDEENEALFNDVVARGDRAMVPAYVNVIRRINAIDTRKGGNLQELFQYGPTYLKGMQDVENLQDLLNSGRITQEMLAEGGLNGEEFKTFSSNLGAFGSAGGMAVARLKAMQRGYANARTIFTGFDAASPAQAPAVPVLGPVVQPSMGPAPAASAPAPPGRLPAQPGARQKTTVRPSEKLLANRAAAMAIGGQEFMTKEELEKMFGR